jgi:hypothetical protein
MGRLGPEDENGEPTIREDHRYLLSVEPGDVYTAGRHWKE